MQINARLHVGQMLTYGASRRVRVLAHGMTCEMHTLYHEVSSTNLTKLDTSVSMTNLEELTLLAALFLRA